MARGRCTVRPRVRVPRGSVVRLPPEQGAIRDEHARFTRQRCFGASGTSETWRTAACGPRARCTLRTPTRSVSSCDATTFPWTSLATTFFLRHRVHAPIWFVDPCTGKTEHSGAKKQKRAETHDELPETVLSHMRRVFECQQLCVAAHAQRAPARAAAGDARARPRSGHARAHPRERRPFDGDLRRPRPHLLRSIERVVFLTRQGQRAWMPESVQGGGFKLHWREASRVRTPFQALSLKKRLL